MALISREALLNDLCEDREEGTFCFTDSQAEAADKIIVYVTKRINAQPSVPAVPLDKLCEFLGRAVTPCILLNIGCPYNEAIRKDCDSCRAREAWKITLSKWTEEQDDTTGI